MGAVGSDLSAAFGLDNAQIGLMIGLFMVPGLFLALPAGFSGRFASDRVLAGLGLAGLALGGAVSAMAAGPGGIGLGRVLSGAGLAASLIFGLVGMVPAGVIIALAGQAVAPERRAFGMGVFFTVYYAIMTASPPVAGWILDRSGAPDGAIHFGAALFALVLPAAMLFRVLKTRAPVAPRQESV